MAANPKPVREMAKTIKAEHKKERSSPVTTYGKVKGEVEKRKMKNTSLGSLKKVAKFRLENKKHKK